jgi:tagatose 6-phosphate kinase
MRCLTITLNPALDTTTWVPNVALGSTNRARRVRHAAAGKGVNVARVLHTLGHDVLATGFLGGATGASIRAALDVETVPCRFVDLAFGESRRCQTIIDDASGSITEVLEPGPLVTEQDRAALMREVAQLAPGCDAAVLAGSVSEGVTPEFLGELMRLLRSNVRRLFVDAGGETLVTLLGCMPDVIKPNEHEMASLMGYEATVDEQVSFIRQRLIGHMMPVDGHVLLTLGKRGAMLVSRDSVLVASAPSLRPVNTVGCGDSLLAGYISSWLAGHDDNAALRHAVACGSAAALCEVAGEMALEDRDRFMPLVRIQHYPVVTEPFQLGRVM